MDSNKVMSNNITEIVNDDEWPDWAIEAMGDGSFFRCAVGRVEKYEADIAELKLLVSEHAEDYGIWFIAETAAEAYLQTVIRNLHSSIESM